LKGPKVPPHDPERTAAGASSSGPSMVVRPESRGKNLEKNPAPGGAFIVS
jgi:hypothetical protein